MLTTVIYFYVVSKTCWLTPSASARYLPISKGHIRRSKLLDMSDGYPYRVNNYLDDKYKPRPTATIVEEANAWVGKELDYNLLLENCENFATLLRYGHGESRQVRVEREREREIQREGGWGMA